MFVLDFRQLVEELADRGVARCLCGLAIEPRCFELQGLGVFAHLVEAERPHQPERLVLDESLHVLAADQRQVVAEFRPIEIEQHGAMAHLFLRHFQKDLGRGGILLAQAFGETAIDAAVLLLVGNGECQDFLLAEIGKTFHISLAVRGWCLMLIGNDLIKVPNVVGKKMAAFLGQADSLHGRGSHGHRTEGK